MKVPQNYKTRLKLKKKSAFRFLFFPTNLSKLLQEEMNIPNLTKIGQKVGLFESQNTHKFLKSRKTCYRGVDLLGYYTPVSWSCNPSSLMSNGNSLKTTKSTLDFTVQYHNYGLLFAKICAYIYFNKNLKILVYSIFCFFINFCRFSEIQPNFVFFWSDNFRYLLKTFQIYATKPLRVSL